MLTSPIIKVDHTRNRTVFAIYWTLHSDYVKIYTRYKQQEVIILIDSELKDLLLSMQNSIINLHGEITETRNSLHDEITETRNSLHDEIGDAKLQITKLHDEIGDAKLQITKLHDEIEDAKLRISKLEMTLENETNKKIDALFDGRIDEIRHRKENIETIAKVADLEMRVDNLEKAFRAS